MLGAIVVALALGAEPSGPLRAGASKLDITPEKPVFLSGYASRKALSEGVHDPLSARAVAFEKDGKRLILVSTDLIGFYGDCASKMRGAIIDACGLAPSEEFLCAIHAHGGPALSFGGQDAHPNNIAYTIALESKLVAAVREALSRLAPAELAFATGSCPVAANRRERTRDASGRDAIRLGRNPSVLTDRSVRALRVSREDKPIAAIFSYASHSTAMGPGNLLITGDLHGLAEQFLERHFEGLIAAAFAGASGDIDPWFRVLPRFETARGWIPEAVLMATMLGEEVAHTLARAEPIPAEGPIATSLSTIELPAKTGGTRPFTITAGRLGGLAIVGPGGEVFDEIGRAIGSAAPGTIVITRCNGAAGYLPTREAYAEGGYAVETSPFAPEAAEMVVAEALRLLRSL